MRHFLASSLALALATAAVAADPRTPMVPAAKAELDRGLAKFASHEYATAITAFDAGFAIDPHPDFLYAKAQAQRLGGDCRGALLTYQAFLATDPPATEAELARSNIHRCQEVLAASGPTVSPEPVKPLPEPRRAIVVETPEVPPPDGPAWWADRPGLLLAGGGLVALGVATAFAVQAKANADATATAGSLDDWIASRDAWQNDRVVAGIATGVGAALVIGAGVRFYSASRRAPVTARAQPTKSGAVLVVEGLW
jgi:hypothetical protein